MSKAQRVFFFVGAESATEVLALCLHSPASLELLIGCRVYPACLRDGNLLLVQRPNMRLWRNIVALSGATNALQQVSEEDFLKVQSYENFESAGNQLVSPFSLRLDRRGIFALFDNFMFFKLDFLKLFFWNDRSSLAKQNTED